MNQVDWIWGWGWEWDSGRSAIAKIAEYLIELEEVKNNNIDIRN